MAAMAWHNAPHPNAIRPAPRSTASAPSAASVAAPARNSSLVRSGSASRGAAISGHSQNLPPSAACSAAWPIDPPMLQGSARTPATDSARHVHREASKDVRAAGVMPRPAAASEVFATGVRLYFGPDRTSSLHRVSSRLRSADDPYFEKS